MFSVRTTGERSYAMATKAMTHSTLLDAIHIQCIAYLKCLRRTLAWQKTCLPFEVYFLQASNLAKIGTRFRMSNMQTRSGITKTTYTHGSPCTFKTNAKQHPDLLVIFATMKQNSLNISTTDKYHRPTTMQNKLFGQQSYFEKLVAATDPKKESERSRP